MNILIICVGKKHTKELVDVITKYEQRLANKIQINWRFIPPSTGAKQQQINNESDMIMRSFKMNDYIILLDETGELLTNQQFAGKFAELQTNGSIGRIVFVIGGVYGVDNNLKSKANLIWSISKLVFPHQLVRLILLEQLYRTMTLLDNHPYHHY